jgi:hypothetical protein
MGTLYVALDVHKLSISVSSADDGLDVRVSVFNELARRVCKFCARGSRKISRLFAVSGRPIRRQNAGLNGCL